jgi:3-oxoacyl-[acyl-carrier protein] reductase
VAVRSVARELRGGATANAVVPAGDVPVDAVGVVAAIRFLLSRRSAFMDGQVLHVDSVAGELPQDWELPLSGKTAVVTGAARGIGAETAAVLARDGARVAVVDVPRAGEELAATANRIGGTALQLDITAADAGQRILAHAGARLGQLDIVVHNAGITRDRLLVNMDATHWDQVMAVNIVAPLRVNEQLLGSDVFSSSGRIICLASISGIAGSRGQANYAASKAGVIGMVQATAKELRGGRTINAVAPGFIETDMTARMPLLVREAARRLSSLRQGGLPVDVAEAVAFLASDAAAGINGETVRVCGQSLVGA